jgi:hypothetical protein
VQRALLGPAADKTESTTGEQLDRLGLDVAFVSVVRRVEAEWLIDIWVALLTAS